MEQSLHAPELLGLELASVLRGLLRSREVTPADAGQAIADLAALGVETYEHLLLLPRVIQLRDNFTVYDAAYVALAEALAAPLLTCDAKFAGGSGHRAAVRVVA